MTYLLRRTCLGMAAAILASSASLTQAADLPCFDEAAMQSARIHDLRVMLMVNALKCRFRDPETLRSYGVLLDERGQELSDHSKLVQLNLSQQYGDALGPVAYNRYETAIANYHSTPAPSQRQCDDVAAYIDLAKRADHAELETLSRLVTNRSIDVCLIPLRGRGEVALANAATLPVTPRSSDAAEGDEALPIVDGIPTYTVPGTGPNTVPEPLETVAIAVAAPVATPAPQANPADAKLDQAILALSAAVTALSDLRQQP